jgi:hypothetical protein
LVKLLNFAMRRAQKTLGCEVNGIAMTGHRGTTLAFRSAAALRAGLGACALLVAVAALAQDARVPNEPAPDPTATQPSDAGQRPGLVETFGRWMEQGATKFKSDMREVQEKLDALGKKARDAAKDAGDAVAGLPNARAVTSRERCPPAQNGAPDCQAAANSICHGKGFKTGKSLDTQTEQKCPARVLLERRAPNANECPTEIFVTRAMCQ